MQVGVAIWASVHLHTRRFTHANPRFGDIATRNWTSRSCLQRLKHTFNFPFPPIDYAAYNIADVMWCCWLYGGAVLVVLVVFFASSESLSVLNTVEQKCFTFGSPSWLTVNKQNPLPTVEKETP